MTTGLNVIFNAWRIGYQSDDVVGGAVLTGSIAYYNVHGSFEPVSEEMLLLQQGLQTEMVYKSIVIPGTLDIRERDEMEIVAPRDHRYYGNRFRVVSSRQARFNERDPRNYMMLTLTRSERSHTEQ